MRACLNKIVTGAARGLSHPIERFQLHSGQRPPEVLISLRTPFPPVCVALLYIIFSEEKECKNLAEKMKIIPLGGLNEIGKNMTVYEHGGEIIVVDCGMGFPDGDMYGIDLVIPDVTYLIKNRARIRGLFITHGHEDHIGAIPYILRQVNMPVYCTRLTAGLIKLKLEEHGLLKQTKLITVEAGEMSPPGNSRSTPPPLTATSSTWAVSASWAGRGCWPCWRTPPTWSGRGIP